MRKQINIALILGFLLIVWLFTHTFMEFHFRDKNFLFKLQKEARKETEFAYTHPTEKDYTIYRTTIQGITRSLPLVIMYDKSTGEAWRYYRNYTDEGRAEEEGWMPLFYKVGNIVEGETVTVRGLTPKVAIVNMRKKLERKKKKEQKEKLYPIKKIKEPKEDSFIPLKKQEINRKRGIRLDEIIKKSKEKERDKRNE